MSQFGRFEAPGTLWGHFGMSDFGRFEAPWTLWGHFGHPLVDRGSNKLAKVLKNEFPKPHIWPSKGPCVVLWVTFWHPGGSYGTILSSFGGLWSDFSATKSRKVRFCDFTPRCSEIITFEGQRGVRASHLEPLGLQSHARRSSKRPKVASDGPK